MITQDLHIHTERSDGSLNYMEIIDYAKRTGLKTIAFTDHDLLFEDSDVMAYGKLHGIEVLAGVEITAADGVSGRPVHLLCYGLRKSDKLKTQLSKTLEMRRVQKLEMIAKICRQYPGLTEEGVRKHSQKSGTIYESHVMQALCDLGYANVAIGWLKDVLISKGGSCYVPSKYPDIKDMLEILDESKGVVVVAHPGQFDSYDCIERFARAGLIRGIESVHPRNTVEDRKRIDVLAEKYDLIKTGGSDFHGPYAKAPHPLGIYGCESGWLEKLKEVMNG